MKENWWIYIIETAQGSLYTGITLDVARRFKEHAAQGKLCAKYLKGKAPLQLLHSLTVPNRTDALKLEYKIKQLSAENKRKIIELKLSAELVWAL